KRFYGVPTIARYEIPGWTSLGSAGPVSEALEGAIRLRFCVRTGGVLRVDPEGKAEAVYAPELGTADAIAAFRASCRDVERLAGDRLESVEDPGPVPAAGALD